MPGYDVNVAWSADDGVFVAEIPELPGCMAHGATPAAARTNAREAMSLWIDTAIEFGRPVPEATSEDPAALLPLVAESEASPERRLGLDI